MELRKDYILDRYVIIAPNRGKRHEIKPDEKLITSSSVCFFCPSNESLTPPEIGRIGEPWKIRWFANKYSSLSPTGKFAITTDNRYFTYSDAYGEHEIVVDTNDHNKQLSDLTDFEIKELLKVYKRRIEELSAKPHIAYVLVFKNCGERAGATLKHSHSQIAALNHVPHFVADKLDAIKKYESCPYCEILNIEKLSDRRCFENSSFVAFTPYASRFNYEMWIFPKKHYISITQLDDWEILELAQILKKTLSKLADMNASYNMFIHNSPQSYLASANPHSMHFHVEIAPRIEYWAGLELGGELIVNIISPEDAAKFYRGEK